MVNNELYVINLSKEYNGQNGFYGDSEKRMNVWNREECFVSECLVDFVVIKEEKEIDLMGNEKFYMCQYCSKVFMCLWNF